MVFFEIWYKKPCLIINAFERNIGQDSHFRNMDHGLVMTSDLGWQVIPFFTSNLCLLAYLLKSDPRFQVSDLGLQVSD